MFASHHPSPRTSVHQKVHPPPGDEAELREMEAKFEQAKHGETSPKARQNNNLSIDVFQSKSQ